MEKNIFNQLGILPLSMNNLLEEVTRNLEEFSQIQNPFDDSHFYKNYPQSDIYYLKDNDTYIIELLVPNFKENELTIRIEEEGLFVSGNKEKTKDDENVKNIYKGIGCRSFKEKPFYFVRAIENVEATLENNILRLEVSLKSNNSKQILINKKGGKDNE